MDATIDKTELVNVTMTKESFEFLQSLANEIETQDNRATAKPYFFVVMKSRWHPCHEDYSGGGNDTKYVRLDRTDEVTEYEDDETGRAEYYRHHKEYIDKEATDQQLEDAWDNLEQCRMEERDEEDNCFLTFKGFEDHVRRNRHNLGKHHSYLKHAYRNPEMDSLFKAISEFKCNT